MIYKLGLRVVYDPISRVIDVRPVLPVVETRYFQALEDKRQLGMTSVVFRAARHSRFIHSLGSYKATHTLSGRWIRQELLTKTEADALQVYALLHDVGHAAYSHTTEDFCPKDHKEYTADLIAGPLKAAIEACGVDSNLVLALASHENPLWRAVCDRNIGTEKLDYLERDGHYTIGGCPMGIEYIRKFTYFIDGRMVIDEKIVDHVIDTMNFYMKMYKEVYLRKSLVIAQRMFHKTVHHLIEAGGLSPFQLPDLTDSELLGMMYASSSPMVRDLYSRLRERRFFREAVVFRPERFRRETRISGKPITVRSVVPEMMVQISRSPLLQKKNHAGLETLERYIAEVLRIPIQDVLVVPVFYPERFEPEDVGILESSGAIGSLKERRPDHFSSMKETAGAYTALRICVSKEHRERASDAASAIEELIFSLI